MIANAFGSYGTTTISIGTTVATETTMTTGGEGFPSRPVHKVGQTFPVCRSLAERHVDDRKPRLLERVGRGFHFCAPTGATTYSPGLPRFGGYPGKETIGSSTATRLRLLHGSRARRHNRVAVENYFLHLTQGSRQKAATLGFTVVAPLGQLMTE